MTLAGFNESDKARESGQVNGLLRFVLGAAGAGKTHLCLTEALQYADGRPATSTDENTALTALGKPDEPNAIILVPDQSTSQYERELLKLSDKPTLTGVSVTGFARLPFFLPMASASFPVAASRNVRRMLLYRAIRENADDAPLLARGSTLTGVLDQALDLLDELMRSGVELDALNASVDSNERAWLSSRLGEMSRVHSDYRGKLDALGMTDELTASARYADALAVLNPMPNLRIWVDGFSHFSAVELRILEELMRIAGVFTISLLVTPGLLAGDTLPPTELVYTSILGHTLETYLRIDAIASARKLVREYIALPQADRRPSSITDVVMSRAQSAGDADAAIIARGMRGAVRVVRVPTRVAEVRHAARAIRRLVAAGARYRDIAVLTRSLSSYEKLIETTFERYGIPCFIDTPRAISQHPAIKLTLDLVSYAVDPSLVTFFELARNPVFQYDPAAVDMFENFVLRVGFHVEEFGTPKFSKDAANTSKDFAALDSLFIVPLAEFIIRLNNCTTADEYSTAILDFMREMRLDARMGEYARGDASWDADVHTAAWGTTITAVEDIAAVCGDERVGLTFYRDLMNAALKSASAKVAPPALDQVVVSDVDRGRQMNPHHIFVLGLIEGEFPRTDPPSGILSPEERTYIKSVGIRLEDDGIRRYIYERYLFYVACTRAAKTLHLTVPVKESSDTLASSFLALLPDNGTVEFADCDEPETPRNLADTTTPIELASWIKSYGGRIFSGLEGIVGAELMRLLESAGFRYPPRLSAPINAYRIGRWARVPVSRLEKLASCPFAHFAAYDLRLRERQVFCWDAPKIGSAFHLALKLTLDESIERRIPWKGGDKSTLLEILSRKFDQALRDPELDLARSSYAMMLARKSYRDLKAFFEHVLVALELGSFTPVAGEVEFGFEAGEISIPFEIASSAGNVFRLTGKIDRIDYETSTGSVAVIDYKSRQTPINWARLYYGLDIQLLMYGYALSKSSTALGALIARAAKALGLTSPIAPPDKSTAATTQPGDSAGAMLPLVLLRHAITPEIGNASSVVDAGIEPKPAKPRGAIHAAAARLLDPNADKWSDYYQIYVGKGGVFGNLKTTDIIYDHEWKTLWRWFEIALGDILQRLDQGDISVKPIEVDNANACAFCEFRQVCRVITPDDIARLPNPGADGKKNKLAVLQTMHEKVTEALR